MALRSKSTAVIVVGVIVLAAVGVWLWTRTAHRDAASIIEGRSAPLATIPSSISAGPAAASDKAALPAGMHDTARNPIAATPDAKPDALPAPAIGAHAGARPLSAEGERRLEKFLAGLRTTSTDANDYETLGRSEAADPDWSPRLEALIRQTIERHAHEFGRLEIGQPRCSKSLCMLTAVATTRDPQALPQADFQRLIYTYMMQEPWFRASFFDASTTVAGDATGDVYVSYFIRK